MVTTELIAACDSAGSLAALFGELGFPVELRRIDLADWPVEPLPDIDAIETYHLFRFAGIDAYIFESSGDARRSIEPFVRQMARRNAVLRTVVAHRDSRSGEIAICGLTGRGIFRRVDISPARPSADALDRLCALGLRRAAGDAGDARRLIDFVLDKDAVGRRFFQRFRQSFVALKSALAAACPGESERARSDHALLLLCRLLFLHFLQQKGWLDRNHRFVGDHLRGALSRRASFHSRTLRPLFFDCLNTPLASRPERALRLGMIPYLNGGLFEPSPFERRNPLYEIPNEVWQPVVEGTFERFSFCVDEDDDAGAHVDPEMLGRVFESLMEDQERAESGSFYTPRHLVEHLVRRAVVEWCSCGDEELKPALEAILAGTLQPKLESAVAAAVIEKLRTIRVLDLACGSGAFLLSAMRVIEALIEALSPAAGIDVEPNLRQRIVERSLAGVDVKSEAVRLCELRLWLAIVSRSDCEPMSVPPLPSLDRNVLQGNSLVGPLDFLGASRAAIYRDWAWALRARDQLVAAYRHSKPDERRRLAQALRESDRSLSVALLEKSIAADRNDLDELLRGEPDLFGEVRSRGDGAGASALRGRIEETARVLDRVQRGDVDFFAFEVHFANAIAAGGFDVIVGNPPWVRASRIEPAARRVYADRYQFFRRKESRGFEQAELALAFFERAISLLAPGGVTAQLLPSKVITARYATEMRKVVASRHGLVEIADWSRQGKADFRADVFPVGLVVRKDDADRPRIGVSDGSQSFVAERALVCAGKPGAPWSIAPPEVSGVLDRIRKAFPTVSEALGRMPVMGVKTGANDRFFVDDVKVVQLGEVIVDGTLTLPSSALVRSVRGRDVRRWRANDSTWMLWPPSMRVDPEADWVGALAMHLGIDRTSLRLAYVRPEHLGIKVGWKDLSRGMKAAVMPASVQIDGEEFPLVPNQTVYSIDAVSIEEAFAIAACFNSISFDALCLDRAEQAKDHHFRYLAATVAQEPFPRLDPGGAELASLVRLSRRAHEGADVQPEIDRAVAKLFGIDEQELELLGRFVEDRLGVAR